MKPLAHTDEFWVFFQSRPSEGGRLYRAEPCFSNKSRDGHPVQPLSQEAFLNLCPPPPSPPSREKLDRGFPYLTPVNAFRY